MAGSRPGPHGSNIWASLFRSEASKPRENSNEMHLLRSRAALVDFLQLFGITVPFQSRILVLNSRPRKSSRWFSSFWQWFNWQNGLQPRIFDVFDNLSDFVRPWSTLINFSASLFRSSREFSMFWQDLLSPDSQVAKSKKAPRVSELISRAKSKYFRCWNGQHLSGRC